jgi:RNA polymerase sigma-70 factor (sigma-E family)
VRPDHPLVNRYRRRVNRAGELRVKTGVVAALPARSWDGEIVLDAPGESAGSVAPRSDAPDEPRAWSADEAVTLLFAAHYRPLVRLAVLLVHDVGVAEDVTQDAYVALHANWRKLRDADKALAYLRASVLNRARSALRRRAVSLRYLISVPPPGTAPSAESGALGLIEHDAILDAVRKLPPRQREAIVLRYYADLSEAEIAEAMGVSRGAVKSHASRGMAALRQIIGREPA